MENQDQVRTPFIANVALALLSAYASYGTYIFAGFSAIFFLFLAFTMVFTAIAFLVRRGRRSALILSAVAGIVFFVFNLPVLQEFLTEPTVFPRFVFAVVAPPVGLLSIISSLLSRRKLRSQGAGAQPFKSGRGASAYLAFAVIGFVVGGLLIGGLAAGTELTLIANSGTTADVTIVLNAGVQGAPLPYSPSPYTVKAGSTVTWVNRDATAHTVTSVGSSLFDSGTLSPGASFKFTFTQPGTYQYYCTIHPWMKGTIVVTSGQ